MLKKAEEEGIKFLSDGSNINDLDDYSPGKLALDELNIKRLLRYMGFTNNEIIDISKLHLIRLKKHGKQNQY